MPRLAPGDPLLLTLVAVACGDDATGTRAPPRPSQAAAVGGLQESQAPRPARTAAPRDRERSSTRTSATTWSSTRAAERSTSASTSDLAAHRGVGGGARPLGLLRRHRVPQDRARLRHPGRRPDGERHGRPRLQHARQAAGGYDLLKGTVAMAKTQAEPAARRGASSTSSRARTRACRPTTRCWQGRRRPRRGEKIGRLGDPASGGAGSLCSPW